MPASSLLGARVGTDAALIVRRPWLGHWRGLVLPLAVLVLLEALVRLDWIPAHQLPAPSQVGQTLWWLAVGGELWGHIGVSLARVAAGFAIGAALAVLIGAWVGLSRRAESYLEPTFQALRAIPSLAWVPLLLLWLEIGRASCRERVSSPV